MHAVIELEAESKQQDEGAAQEQQRDKSTKESSEHFPNPGTEARATSTGASIEKLEKERDCPQQREAVIRPQQTGKIDFRSLQNRSKLATDRTWSTGKGSPQSPSGKGRSKEKGKRSGKTECSNPQQLYRLSITNPRSNPNIGIAYPQQKVSPPKRLESSRGPVTDRYIFHIQSIPEREGELHQEELSYSRCFQEASSNLTSPSYTSQALVTSSGTSSHLHPPLSQQQPASMESNSSQPGGQLILSDFQLTGSNTWQSPERTFNGANFGVSSQKNITFTEAHKTNAFAPAPFQYGYNFLEESNPDSFACEPIPQSQDCTNSLLGSGHVTHKSFSFATEEEAQNIAQSSTQYSNEQQEDRSSYPQPTQFIQAVASSIQCPRSLSEDSVGSDSSGSQHSEQGKSESTDIIGQADSREAAITSGNKRNCHSKDASATQRKLIPGGVHHARNISQVSGSQMHFSSKTFGSPVSNIHTGTITYDKNINNKALNRFPNTWEGPNKALSQPDQNTLQYSMNDNDHLNDKFRFQNQTALDQRSSPKNSRMPWQQIRPTSAVSNQSRLEMSRQINSPKMAYMVSSGDWQDDGKSQKHSSLKSPGSFQNSRTSEGFSNQRQEAVKHNSNAVLSFKTEMGHAQVCESKNKPLYFGLNQSLPTASPRRYSFPPLQVPPLGHMMVSPYESPLPSPIHNPASSSTCSSLSPASNSPVNTCSEDNQISKSTTLHPFYHQSQAKTQLPTEQLSSHQHPFQPDTPQSLPFATDRAKDDMMSYLQSSTHPKPPVDGNKVYVDSFGLEHHQPPPPYSAHQLLATSLATANLDQLDVLLKCRQCDQNFNNLASFLGHKQFCAQQTISQSDLKDVAKIEHSRKLHAEPAKAVSSLSSVSISRCPSDLHLSLLGLNKNGELISDSETKGDSKDETTKLNFFSGSGSLPAPLPELEMDSKLDSLITEALNGYQSDNAEIDSSFMDALVDDELTSVKATSTKQGLKAKESLGIESKTKKAINDDSSFRKEKYFYESDTEGSEIDKKYIESKTEKMPLNLEQNERLNINTDAASKSSRFSFREKMGEQDRKEGEVRKLFKSEDKNVSTQKLLLSKLPQRVQSFQDNSALQGSTRSQASTSPPLKTAVKESKRKNTGGGTWSKELIHKIVQQKNKLHKLHVKGAKNLQFSLVMERLTPAVQNPAFGEYDYVSDTDDECEPVKIASQGRLNQSSRCKYTYTKECKRRAKNEREQAAWKNESKECFDLKKSEEVSLSPEKPGSQQKLRRRGSRSSTSSEVSTSINVSSEAINSPKSAECNNSDCEKKADIKKRESPGLKTYERSPPQKLVKESCTLTFTKSAKKYGSDKGVVSDSKNTAAKSKDHRSLPDVADPVSSMQKDTNRYFDTSRSSYANGRGDAASARNTVATSESLQSTDILCPRDEPAHCSSPDSKPLHSKKEADSTVDRRPKGKTGEDPAAAQLGLSDSNTFEKQSVHMVKESISLASYIHPHKTASLCSALMDEVCLSPAANQSQIIPKDALQIMNYSLDQEQSLIKSPLSFDTSSMFEDLTGFESGLYPDMPIQKEGFHSMENIVDKKEVFVSSFSTFLEHRDWNLMVSPVLPDEISQYKGNTEKSSEKKQDYNHIPLSLPERIIDYTTNLNSCTSEDELEIKRIVNELETQLQTTKKESPPVVAQDVPKLVKMSKFSPLRLDDEVVSEGSGLDISCTVQNIEVPVPSLHSEPFTGPWASPFRFDIIGGNHHAHTSINNEEEEEVLTQNSREDNNLPDLISIASHQKSEGSNAEKATKEEILDEKRYTENLMKSLEVLSDSIFKKVPIISEHKALSVPSPASQQHQQNECQAKDAAERENQSEKEAITGKKNLLSPSNINKQKDDIKYILNESQSSLCSSDDPSVDGNHSIPAQRCKPTESNTETRTEAISVENITVNSHLIETARYSSVASNYPQLIEETGKNHSTAENVNLLFKYSVERQELLTADSQEESTGKGTPGCPKSHSMSSALHANASPYIRAKVQAVVTAAYEKQSTDEHNHSTDNLSPCAGELRGAEKTPEETAERNHFIGLPPKNCSPERTYSPTPMSVQITDRPCSPILEKSTTEHKNCSSPVKDTRYASGSSHMLHLPQSDSMTESEACKETLLTRFEISEPEEILNVRDISNLPVDFMASHQNSPCRDVDQSRLRTSPNSPFLTSSHQTALQNWDPSQSPSKCDDTPDNKDSIQSIKSPTNKEEDTSLRNTLNTEDTSTVMEYSLISPPPLDLGMIVSKISSCESVVASSPPVPSSAEPQAPGGPARRNPVYNFKLSPLNYRSISDEPPQLSQYDYIPISPISKPEDTSDIKQSPRDGCGACDLSINPALIFNNTQTATSVTVNSDVAGEMNLPTEPLVLPQSMKYLCFSLGLTPEGKPEDPSAQSERTDLGGCPDPLSKTKTADNSTSSKSLLICEGEHKSLPPESSLDHPRSEQISLQLHKEVSPKKVQSNSQQGKVICEVCLMCFRTVPGLKRHKAMKHSVRTEKHISPQSTASIHQEAVSVYEASQNADKEHKDDSQTCLGTKIDGLPEASDSSIPRAAEPEPVLEEMAMETRMVAADKIGSQNPVQPTKSKKYNKARKSKNSEVNVKPDPFSDEILNILKTDILQALNPEFKSCGLKEQHKSPEKQVQINHKTVPVTENLHHQTGFQSPAQMPEKEISLLDETVELNQATNTQEMNLSLTDIADGEEPRETFEETVSCLHQDIIRGCDGSTSLEKMCEAKGSKGNLAQEILRSVAVEKNCTKSSGLKDDAHPLSCLNTSAVSPPGLSPELKALLDDDTTFSQLFPRDEDSKRKKCPRVYSKRNKRQKLSADSTPNYSLAETFVQKKEQPLENQAEQKFAVPQTNHCNYETISIDDAMMLNMCHNNTLKADPKSSSGMEESNEHTVHESIKELDKCLFNPLECTIDTSAIEQNGSEDLSVHSSVTSDPSIYKVEVPTGSCPVTSSPYSVESFVAESVQALHTIDIQNINTTFQLPEIQFFDPNRDIVSPPVGGINMELKEEEKSKTPTEQPVRKRPDGRIKVKDKQYKCKVCFTWFLTLGELNFHKLSHNPSPPPTCYMCVQRKFSSREQLRDHLREKHAKNKTGTWSCGMCLKEISDVWMYNEHLREHATQFARKGQTQGSMLGISGCFMQETAVKNFITSILQQRPSKTNRESSKVIKEQERILEWTAVGEGRTSEGVEPKGQRTKSSSGTGRKQSTSPPIEVLHKTETHRSVEMHPNCKDPSRDCHHCGKQFPKPFKLQRHLVVHNVEKIFLCHKCPVSYLEAQELKSHLRRAHEEVEELDSKHTTLYTCELCADVMHVIKKSFICSTCNYTFSKKEQFDRHMEKHLSGGNKIFKFRGVLRPVNVSASKQNECDSPAAKKRRILSDSLQENSSDSGIASVSSLHLNQNSETHFSKAPVSTADDSTQTVANKYHRDTTNTNVKTEEMTEDYTELLVELEKCIQMESTAPAMKEEMDPVPSTLFDKEGNGMSVSQPCEVKEEDESVFIRVETTSLSVCKDSSCAGEKAFDEVEASAEGGQASAEGKTDSPASNNTSVISSERQILPEPHESTKHELAADVVDLRRDDEQQQHSSKASNGQFMFSESNELESSHQIKDKAAADKAADNMKNTTASPTKSTDSTPVLPAKLPSYASATNGEREPVRPQKKRKDLKSPLQRVSSPATQENFAVDSRAKKKFRHSKCANPSLQRKSDGSSDYSVLSSVQDDVVSNKIASKCKTSSAGLQSKKSFLDSCTPKKTEIVTPLNGDYKVKKGPLGRALHSPISKVPSGPMNNALNKTRPKMAVRSMESHSYRTAESQNHLLSQLFGQKLTSFKIPLRKDTSESIN